MFLRSRLAPFHQDFIRFFKILWTNGGKHQTWRKMLVEISKVFRRPMLKLRTLMSIHQQTRKIGVMKKQQFFKSLLKVDNSWEHFSVFCCKSFVVSANEPWWEYERLFTFTLILLWGETFGSALCLYLQFSPSFTDLVHTLHYGKYGDLPSRNYAAIFWFEV